MQLKELTKKKDMLLSYPLLKEIYPNLTLEEYSSELDKMIPHNYGQVVVIDGDRYVGISAYWIGNKLWCGKYLECDNVVVSQDYRRKGVAKKIFDYLEKKALEEACNMMALDSYRHNTEAHKFFEGEGFDPRGFHFIKVFDESKIR